MPLSRRLGRPTSAGRRRWFRAAVVSLILLIVLVAAAPYLVAWKPIRDPLVALAASKINGTVEVGQLSVGWFTPLHLADVKILPHEGPPLVELPLVTSDASLADVLLRTDLGAIHVERPHVHLELTDRGLNFVEVFQQPKQDEAAARANVERAQRVLRRPPRSIKLAIRGASVSVHTQDAADTWTIDGIQATAGVDAGDAEAGIEPFLYADPCILVDHADITAGMCQDLLEYIAPVLAGATIVSGQTSLEVDECRVPTAAMQDGVASGRLSLHKVDVVAGPLVAKIAAILGVPPKLVMADEAVIECRMQDRRVHHEGMKFAISALGVETSGSVGFDRSLDLIATVTLNFERSADASRPILDALSGQHVKLLVQGTLDDPKIRLDDLDEVRLFDLLAAVRARLAADGQSANGDPSAAAPREDAGRQQLVEDLTIAGLRLAEDLLSRDADSNDGESQPPAALGMLQELLRRRAENRRAPPPATTPPATPNPSDQPTTPPPQPATPTAPQPDPQPPPRGRLLRRAFDLLRPAAKST